MKQNRLFLIAFFIFAFHSTVLLAQNSIPQVGIGQWRYHIPYSSGQLVADAGSKVYCATKSGMFVYNKDDGGIDRLSKITGLAELEITTIAYNASKSVLVVAYSNANIDLIYDDGTIINISDIKRKNITSDKTINNIVFRNNFAYLAASAVGIVVIDLDKKEIKDTYYIFSTTGNNSINALTFNNNTFYAAASSGIYFADINNPNIFNYTAWQKDLTSLAPNADHTSIAVHNNKVYSSYKVPSGNDVIEVFDGSSWTNAALTNAYSIFLSTSNGLLIVKTVFGIASYDNNMNIVHNVTSLSYANANPVAAVVDAQNIMWAADANNGLNKITLPFDHELINPNGPFSTRVWKMAESNGSLWVTSGSVIVTGGGNNNGEGVYRLTDNTWRSYNKYNDPGYDSLVAYNVTAVAVDPDDDKHAFVGTWASGVLEYNENGVANVYNANNSPFTGLNVPNYHLIQVGGLAFDSQKSLWCTQNVNNNALLRRTKSGAWSTFNIPVSISNYFFFGLTIDDNDQKWFIPRTGSTGLGLAVYYENDANNPNDDNVKLLTDGVGNGNLSSKNINAVVKDKDGALWIGTEKGVCVIYNPANVFTGADFDAQKILVEIGGFAQYLLESEVVTAIAVDGANRKWFGTNAAGVFLQSSDGSKQLLNFNKDNSPLPSNTINDIAIDSKTGEVFFGTDKGIVSYRSDATEGGTVCDDYSVFPNPVSHDYSGPIAINGLVKDAAVKIVDTSGQLVYETKANGGLATWYGNNMLGVRVQTGVYTVLVANEDGSESCTAKILFVN